MNFIVRAINLISDLGKLVRLPIQLAKKIKFPDLSFPKIVLPKLKLPKIKIPKRPLKKKKKAKIKKRTKRRRTKTDNKIVIFVLGIIFSYVFIYFPLQAIGWYKNLPRPELLSQINNKSTKILDRKGRLLYEIYIDKNYDPVSLSVIPEPVIDATLAIEDEKFYSHGGIRLGSMVRAMKDTVMGGKLQGGSTITQQLVKNVLLSPERTVSRKTKEIVVSLMVEGTYSKDTILELYLNNISYGGTSWGIQAASQRFFGKDVWDLNLAEAAFLAGLPSAPSTYSPFSGGGSTSKERQRQVLQRMVDLRYITQKEASEAYSTELVFIPQQEYIRAPHFVNYVRKQLEETYGKRMVEFGGLTVRTTLDLDLQDQVQQIVTEEVLNNAYLNISNGAAVVLDVRTGEVLAYVGSIDFFSEEIDGEVDVATAFRQPGSSIKPVTYALAFENGLTPATTIEDEKITFNFPGSRPYTPVNYDGKFHGKVTLRSALANSYNIPAVKLANRLGPDNIVELGKKLGLQGWEVDGSYGVSITLGGKEVRLLDLTNAFATFSRKGEYINVSPFVSVLDSNGYEINEAQESGKETVSKGVAYLITHILSDNNARSPAFGSNSTLVVPGHQVAVKTGTTDAKRDNWTIGYTPSFVAGVWVGNNDNTPMNPFLSSGLSGASPIWNRIMKTILASAKPERFEAPNEVFVKIDSECDNKSEVFIKGTAPTNLCDLEDKESSDDRD